MIKNKHIVIGVIIVIAILIISFGMPLQWVWQGTLIEQTNHENMVMSYMSDMCCAQAFVPDTDIRIWEAEAYLKVVVPPTDSVYVRGGISTVLTSDYSQWIWNDIVSYDTPTAGGWEYFCDRNVDYAEISAGQTAYFIIKMGTSEVGSTVVWYGDDTNPYPDGNSFVVLSSPVEIPGKDFAFKLGGEYWQEDQPDVTCWACQGDIPISQTFPAGTICGSGSAINYPYTTEPTDCGNGGSDTWDLTVIAEDKDTGDALSGAEISISSDTDTTDSSGIVVFLSLAEGTYTISGTLDGYTSPDDITVNLYQNREITMKFTDENGGNGNGGEEEGIEITMNMIMVGIIILAVVIIGAILPIAGTFRIAIIIVGILISILIYLILEGFIGV